MKLIKPTAEQAPYGLRALKMVAEAPGSIHPSARKLIMAAQEHLAGTRTEIDDLPPGNFAGKYDSIGQPGIAPRLFRAIERGSMMTRDLSAGFVVWPYVERTLDDLRREWNVVPE
jgi:hypothetical protein